MTSRSDPPQLDYQALFQSMATPAAALDAAFVFVDVNDAFAGHFGYQPQEIIGRSLLSITDPVCTSAVGCSQDLLRLFESHCVQAERRIIARSGQAIDTVLQLRAFDTAGHRHYSAMFRDCSVAQARERLLISRAEMFRLTIEQSPMPISLQDEDFRLILVNRAYCDLVGYSESELLGQDPIDFLHSDLDDRQIQLQRQALRGSNLQDLPRFATARELRHRDGRRIAYRMELGHSRGIDGRTLWCAMLIDLSKLADTCAQLDAQIEATRQIQSRFDTFASCVDEAVLVINSQTHRIEHANAAVRDVFGVDPAPSQQLLLEQFWLQFDIADRTSLNQACEQFAQGLHAQAIVELVRPDGRPASLRLRLFRGAAPWPEYFMLAEDVTENRRAERKRLSDAIEQRDSLVREVHHRIKNNLQGTSGLLRRAELKEPRLAGVINELSDQIFAIAQVHGLLIEGADSLAPADLLSRIAASRSASLGGSWSMQAGTTDGPCWRLNESEAVSLALVINELLTNAFKHSSGGGDIMLALDSRADRLVVSISNPGRLGRQQDPCKPQPISTGLGLVRALLPPQGATLRLSQAGGRVITELVLSQPVVRRA